MRARKADRRLWSGEARDKINVTRGAGNHKGLNCGVLHYIL